MRLHYETNTDGISFLLEDIRDGKEFNYSFSIDLEDDLNVYDYTDLINKLNIGLKCWEDEIVKRT
jgi:hypothetical protein